jgi:general stress protein 26
VENDSPRSEEIGRIARTIRGIDVAMLTTVSEDGSLRSRPLATQREEFDGTVWFFVPGSGPAAEDCRRRPSVAVVYSDPKEERYVSISGRARIVRDPVRIAQLWHPALQRWFPKGQEDPDLALLEIPADAADVWDAHRSATARVYEKLRSVTSGEMPSAPEHDRVDFLRR